jgi:hypothetical protein
VFDYRHLVLAPVFQIDRRCYLRVGGEQAVVLSYINGLPVEYFDPGWVPVLAYTGLGCMHLLAFENDGRRATWLVAPDGRRLGDRLADLHPDMLIRLRDAVSSRGSDALASDGLRFIEPLLRDEILNLAVGAESAAAAQRRAPDPGRSLAMLGAPHKLRTHLRFRPGDGRLMLREGWAVDTAGGSCRAVAGLSTARAGIIPPASCHLLTLMLVPAASDADQLPTEIEIAVNGQVVGHVGLDPRWQGKGAEFAFWLAPELVGGKPFEIAFRHSRDFMLGGLKLMQGRALPAMPPEPSELMLQFENIGDNCEFGLVQRHFGAEPVGLLRFAGMGDPYRLIRFLDDDFGRFGEPGSLGVNIVGDEYFIIDQVYGIAYHTFRNKHEFAAEQVIHENEIKAGYLKRKFREDLEDGEKILVYKRVVTQDPHEMIAVHAALNRLGAVNKLLWVTQADDRHASGDVEWVGDRLLKGYIGTISLSNAHDFDAEAWLRLCRNALVAFTAAEPH